MSKSKNSHFKLDDRISISKLLDVNTSFRKIAEAVGAAVSSITNEVKGRRYSRGSLYFGDSKRQLCDRLLKAPWVCNGCKYLTNCKKPKYLYDPYKANEAYKTTLIESRNHIHTSAEGIKYLNKLLDDRIATKSQGINHIFNSNDIGVSKSTIYRYIDNGVLNIKNIDLKRKVRYKDRHKDKVPITHEKPNKAGRKYIDFLAYKDEHPEARIAELDTVIGKRDEGYNIFTILLRKSNFMIGIFLKEHTAKKICEALDYIEKKIGKAKFMTYFNICLTDNGHEFEYTDIIEASNRQIKRCHLFYCDPRASEQKGKLEKNHEFIRDFIPKGQSMSHLNQEIVTEMFSHINSIKRDELNHKSPFELLTVGETSAFKKLGYHEIPPKEVVGNFTELMKLINSKK